MVAIESKFAELKEKEKQARKQIVIESASALFSKRPFYEVGMRDVAEEAGISPATIYRYFPSQEDLFYETFLHEISSATRNFKMLIQQEKPMSIEEFAISFIEYIIENESAFQMMTYLMFKENLGISIAGKFDSATKVFFDLFQDLLVRHGVESTTARLYSRSFIASMVGILLTFRNYPTKDTETINAFIFDVVKRTAGLYSDQLLKK